MREQQSDGDKGADEFLLQEYEQFLSMKAAGTINAYVRTTRQVMEWVARRPGNGGHFHSRQLTKTAVEVYLASLEQEGFSLNHRARVKSTISQRAKLLMVDFTRARWLRLKPSCSKEAKSTFNRGFR